LENLQTKVDGVVTSYDHPFTHDDHEAITANIPVFGEVKGGRVVYAYDEDRKRGADVRVKGSK
jgi:branched-chain amino acid transport system substrate-binding protein